MVNRKVYLNNLNIIPANKNRTNDSSILEQYKNVHEETGETVVDMPVFEETPLRTYLVSYIVDNGLYYLLKGRSLDDAIKNEFNKPSETFLGINKSLFPDVSKAIYWVNSNQKPNSSWYLKIVELTKDNFPG